MNRQILKDRNANSIGYIDTDSDGKQTIKDKNGNTKGYYYPRDNLTKDRNNNTIGHGNLLTTLL